MSACSLFESFCRILWLTSLSLLLAACATTPQAPIESRTTIPAQTSKTKKTSPQENPVAITKRSGGYYQDDGPEDNPPPNLASIPDAEPQVERLNPFANRPYTALGQSYTPMQEIKPYRKEGRASWYGKKFHGKRTSSGDIYAMYRMTAAHPTLPIPSYARVTNLANNQTVVVRINDRGPFHRERLIDLSYTAAWKLGYINQGSANVLVESIVPEEIELVKRASKDKIRPAETNEYLAVVRQSPPSSPQADPIVTKAESALSSPDSGIYLQLGAFASSLNADQFKEYVLHELNWLQHSITSQFGNEKYRLHLGPFETVGEAKSVAERIATAIKLKPFVVIR